MLEKDEAMNVRKRCTERRFEAVETANGTKWRPREWFYYFPVDETIRNATPWSSYHLVAPPWRAKKSARGRRRGGVECTTLVIHCSETNSPSSTLTSKSTLQIKSPCSKTKWSTTIKVVRLNLRSMWAFLSQRIAFSRNEMASFTVR